MTLRPLLALSLAATCVSASAQPISLSYQQSERGGVCYFSVDGPGPAGGSETMTLEFSYRVEDGNLGLDLKAASFPKATGGDPDKNLKITFETDSGAMPGPRSGGYAVTSRYQRIWGGWGAGAPSQAALEALRTFKTVTVLADGARYGPFSMQVRTLPYNVLNNCAKRVRGEPTS